MSSSAKRLRDNRVLQSILFRGQTNDHPLLIADLCDRGTLGIIEEDAGFRAFFADYAAAEAVLA